MTENTDQIYHYDPDAHDATCARKPWTTDVHYFKKVKISPPALVKMVMHACSGGDLEVMGLLQGKIDGDTMIVMDSFPLPVEGSETRVNAHNEANEYIITELGLLNKVGKLENAMGWYHSHPGYGCWLSGIDVATQMTNQRFQEPWLAIVVDPKRTLSSGKVELGAFRTYPEGHKIEDEGHSEYQMIPLNKIEDFGVHCKQYYQLEVSYFKSMLDSSLFDLLWNKYWVNTLSSSPILSNKDFISGQIVDLAEKLENVETQMPHLSGGKSFSLPEKKASEDQLAKIARDGSKSSIEQVHGLMAQVMKDILFNHIRKPTENATPMEL